MKISFKVIFIIVAAIVVGYALHDFKSADLREAEKNNQNRVLPGLDPKDVKSVRVLRPMGELFLLHDDESWKLEKPIQDLAGLEIVENFVMGIANLKLTPVELEGTPVWSDYGLEKPEATFEIEHQVGGGAVELLRLDLGSVRTVDGGYYIRKNKSNQLYASTKEWTHLSLVLPNELREKTVMLWKGQITKIERKSGENWILAYSKKDWTISEPTEAVVNKEALNQFLKAVRDLEADKILDQAKPKSIQGTKPSLILSLTATDSPEPLIFNFIRAGDLYRVDSPGRSFWLEISKEKLASIDKDAAYFINQPPTENKNDKDH